jgi:hypothetical protein
VLVIAIISLLTYLLTFAGLGVLKYTREELWSMNWRNGICAMVNLFILFITVQQPRGGQNIPLTPPARISAMNIVGDLLRKVGVSIIS